MKNSKDLLTELISALPRHLSKDESRSIAHVVLMELFGISKTSLLAEKEIEWTTDNELAFQDALTRLGDGEPVQYFLGSTEFYGRKFFVDYSVLIPRPETEELVQLILSDINDTVVTKELRILDIGTGSGCIPVTLSAEFPSCIVMATDVSDKALAVARKNVLQHHVQVQLLLHDILKQPLPYRNLDIIVSNPPYISEKEKDSMDLNVLHYEPHLALFVPDDDPLRFYKAIIQRGKGSLNNNARVFFEINEQFGAEVAALLEDEGFSNVEVRKDISGKDRIVKAIFK